MRIPDIIAGVIVAIAGYFVMAAIGWTGPMAIFVAAIGFFLGVGVRRTFWPT